MVLRALPWVGLAVLAMHSAASSASTGAKAAQAQGAMMKHRGGEIFAGVRVRDRQVVIEWSYHPFPDDPGVHRYEKTAYAERYVPTCVVALDARTLLVAGGQTRPRAETVIERWTFSEASGSVREDPGSRGGFALELEPGRREEVHLVYADGSEEREDVMCLFPLLGSGGERALVLFEDSRDLYDLELRTGSLLRVASPDAARGGLHVPELEGGPFDVYWAGEHRSEGYVYVLGSLQLVADGSTLVLIDANRDGALDRAELLSEERWGEAFGLAEHWVR